MQLKKRMPNILDRFAVLVKEKPWASITWTNLYFT